MSVSSTAGRAALVLAAALVVGAAARLPGVFWGANFPFGWQSHHVDEGTHLLNTELLVSPHLPPRRPPNPYPKGAAAHAAVPLVLGRALDGRLMAPPPSFQTIVTTGRVVSVFYGLATLVLVYIIARRFFGDPAVAEASTLLLSLGGMHVTQSHFFLADVPALFWHLAGCYFLFRAVLAGERDDLPLVGAAAFCLGVACGIKLMGAALPSLVLVALTRPPRIFRVLLIASFTIAGFVLVNLNSYSLLELVKTVANSGGEHVKSFSRLRGLLIYLAQLPAILSAPMLALSIYGAVAAIRRWSFQSITARRAMWIAIIAPQVLYAIEIIFIPNNFPRHLLPVVPWAAMLAGYGLVRLARLLAARGLPPWLPATVVLLYLAAFVYDGERVFIQDPRNDAARWLQTNVPAGATVWWQSHGGSGGYEYVEFPSAGRPDVLVMELHRANSYLSGMGLKNSFPVNFADVHGVHSEVEMRALQAVFKGTSEYREMARFTEGYVMPEFRLVDGWLGNRARNYVSEIVVFRR